MRHLLCWLRGHPAGVRQQLSLHTPALVIPATEPVEQVVAAMRDGWYSWWTGYRCTRCGGRYP